ncbi:MAG: type II toxin-antitoxin system ParD family antitoxin [Isosphaeraceae bacterium]
MNISLTPELERYVHGKVQEGMYHSASEVVREGLRLLREKDELHQKKLEQLRQENQVGIDQADRGRVKHVALITSLAEAPRPPSSGAKSSPRPRRGK